MFNLQKWDAPFRKSQLAGPYRVNLLHVLELLLALLASYAQNYKVTSNSRQTDRPTSALLELQWS